MISVPFPMAGPEGSEVDRYLDEQGWPVRNSAAIVMTAPPDLIAGAAGGPAAGPAGGTAESTAMTLAAMTLAAEPDEDWLARYHYRGTVLPPIARRLLLSAPWQAFGSVRADGQTIAIGRVAAAGGWAGLTAIEVDPGHRRRGLGRAVTAALAAAAADRGLTGLYLQVEAENTVARSLYHRLGFTDHHRYHYRVAPAG
jgi:GNAT superfamily N-acetyltransferase